MNAKFELDLDANSIPYLELASFSKILILTSKKVISTPNTECNFRRQFNFLFGVYLKKTCFDLKANRSADINAK